MSKKIVIIEPEQDKLDLLAKQLNAFGYDVSSAPSADEGITLVTNEQPDLILVDTNNLGPGVYDEIKGVGENTPILTFQPSGYQELLNEVQAKLPLSNEELMQSIEKKNLELEKSSFELALHNEVVHALSYSLDYIELFRMLLNKFYDVFNSDVWAVISKTETGWEILLEPQRNISDQYKAILEEKLVSEFNLIHEEKVDRARVHTVVRINENAINSDNPPIESPKSYLNIPIVVELEAVSLICLASEKEGAFVGK